MFVITALCLLVVAGPVGRFTEWGRQFWRITGDYFKGRQSVPVWAMVGLLLLSVILSVRINVLLSYYSNDLFTALQVAFQGGDAAKTRPVGIDGFWATMLVFAVLAVCYVVRTLLDMYVTQRFIMRMANLVEPALHRRLARRLRVLPRPVLAPADRQPGPAHPAGHRHLHRGRRQRAEQPGLHLGAPLLFGAVEAVLSVFSFGAILWRLSGPADVGRRHACQGACSGSSSSTCWWPRSSRSSSAGR